MKILAIETSCDETGVAVLEMPKNKILFEILSSQVDIHSKTYGIVPEIASRLHSEILPQFLKQVDKKIGLQNIDYIATTSSPGLLGSLLVGNNFARMLGYLYKKPLLSVNHLLGHFYAAFINMSIDKIEFPALSLIVSGGHTILVYATAKNKNQKLQTPIISFKIIGETLDDAAGEAFDKIARLLNLCYPGGPLISKMANQVKKSRFKFTTPMSQSSDFNFSFSGLKTQVRQTVEKITSNYHLEQIERSQPPSSYKMNKKIHHIKSSLREEPKGLLNMIKSEIAFAAQNAIIDSLVQKSFSATTKYHPKTFVLGGGVAANQLLRQKLVKDLSLLLPKNKIFIPELKYATDNATMIAFAGYMGMPKNIITWDKLETSPTNKL